MITATFFYCVKAARERPAEARRWWREAITIGHPEGAVRAAQQLRDLDRRQKDLQQANWYARYGWQTYADPSIMRRPLAPQPKKPCEEEEPPAPQ
ncbi:hypothetical protein ABZU32_38885 [Sphaerisporangium sp. NPDC005288]|uniref:hypothetical protein n=1 Tax=Sphaerisporangium sp. NPDC005288 TaxID=3155114 RepID=UPI0033A2426A